MSRSFAGWPAVAAALEARAHSAPPSRLNTGQRAALRAVAQRIPDNGILIADEVGMGKTRIAVEVSAAVVRCGGRAAIVVPPGLGYQWRSELKEGFDSPHSEVAIPEFLRSLGGFLAPWRDSAEGQPQTRGWFRDSIVLLSHAFSNWRLGGSSQGWRWGLLPALYVQARKEIDGRFPREYEKVGKCGHTVRRAATDICAASLEPRKGTARRILEAIREEVPWPAALEASEYGKQDSLRQYLENAVGLGLGTFDLVIVDEAHKSRGDESRLSSLLANVIHSHSAARYLALTATPVELNASQWSSSLARVGLSEELRRELTPIISRYSEAAHKLRISWRTSEEARTEYMAAAEAFERALRPYVLRRDKREDPIVQAFATTSGRQPSEYRQELEVAIETSTLARPWKQVVCAAEALSVSTRQVDNSVLKRLRLSIGNGHGIAALMDQARREPEDQKQLEHDDVEQQASPASSVEAPPGTKQEARIAWWRRLIDGAVASSSTGEPLFEHPAILAAVDAIEAETRAGEKVLVFGRFTRPMRALAALLNAREMLRRLESGEPWPQAKVHDGDHHALQAAHAQLQSRLPLDALDARLAAQYAEHRRAREQDRDQLLKRLRSALPPTDRKAMALLRALDARAATASAVDERHPLALVTRAITELNPELDSDGDWARAFVDLIDGVTDRDEGDDNGDGELDEEEAGVLWRLVEDRLHEEFNRPQGGFARLMNGQTPQPTRRMLQLAFNRPTSLPQVLIAQSLVGREGLNLHHACRTVVLLHPEWNPGVVEQQIGRVDRVGSRWEHLMKTRQDHEPLPRISIRPIVFRGTYDEHNWQVLRDRWDDHRAQLHGVPVPHRQAFDDPESATLIEQLAAAAPNFSPLKVTR